MGGHKTELVFESLEHLDLPFLKVSQIINCLDQLTIIMIMQRINSLQSGYDKKIMQSIS